MALIHNDCRGLCDWHATEELIGELPLFRCTGCRSKWTPAERWTQDPQGGEPTLVTPSRPCLRLRPDAGGCVPVIVQTGWRKRSISSVSIVGVGPIWVATMAPSAQAKSSASSGEAPLSSL